MAGFMLGARQVGSGAPPLVIAEIGINHEGDLARARQMVRDAAAAGCECVKFQCHVIEDEMIPNDVVPGNASESIWDIMRRCALDAQADAELKALTESLGMIYLSTPFSRAAADRVQAMGVVGYKVGSGECNNLPLLHHIASFGKPVILSTGMNDLASVDRSVAVLRGHGVPVALLHCTSVYPTPYDKVRLGAVTELCERFPDAVIGLSDHSIGNYTCFGAVALGADILEKHFCSDRSWPGPDIPISILPGELSDLVRGSAAVHAARGGHKGVLPEEQPTIDFAYASVVSTRAIRAGEAFTKDNTWVKRPGTGEILAAEYEALLGRTALSDLPPNHQIRRAELGPASKHAGAANG